MAKEVKNIVGLTPPKPARTTIELEGMTSLIVNAMTPKKINEILEAQTKSKSVKRKPKDVEEAFRDSLYVDENGEYVFPAIALKKAVIGAAHTYAENIPKTRIRGSLYIPTDWVKIISPDPPKMRKDVVRVGRGADVRIRGEFEKWRMEVPIDYDENGVVSLEQIINLFEIAGFSVGIGDWRPACDGIHGRFKVKMDK